MTRAALDHHGGIDQPSPFVRSFSSPLPSFYDPGFCSPSSSSSSSSLPRLPTIAPAFAQRSPLDNAALAGGHYQPPHWSPAATGTTPYLGSYPRPGDQEPASALPGPDRGHFPSRPSPYSQQDRIYSHRHDDPALWDHLAQRHQDRHLYHHPTPSPYQAGASTLPTSSRPPNLACTAAATSTTAALGRDPVACLEWDCALEDPPLLDPTLGHELPQPPQQQYPQPHHQHQIHLRQQQQQTYYHHQYSEPSANASEAAVATNSYTSRFGHRDGATMIASAEICRTAAAPNMSATTESLPGGTLALVDEGQGPRLSPGGLADLLLLYPESARHALQTQTQRPTPTITTTAAATSSAAPPPLSGSLSAAALPSLGVSVPSPLFAWFAGGHINKN